MDATACHAKLETPQERARRVVLKELGVKRVADWCGVKTDTVYQWLSRGDDEHPVPVVQVPKIVAGAKAEGLVCSLGDLWPAGASLAGNDETLRLARAS